MKKLLAIFILACIFLSPALTSSAAAHDYDYVYTDVNIITPDSFEDIFSETEADRASFTYEMATLNSSRAVVAMEIELKVGSDYYTTIVSGDIPAYTLPSGDTLYEGPISGTMTVSEDEYRVTAGFTKLKSTGGVLVSITMQGDSTMVAFSFGENLIQGEVLDFFMEKAGSGQQNNTAGSNIIGNLDSDEFGNNPGDTASPMLIPGFSPIFNPGEGGSDYPNLGGAVFHRIHDDAIDGSFYKLVETRIYINNATNHIIVTLKPFLSHVTTYINNTMPEANFITLDSFEVKLTLDNPNPSNYAEIVDVYLPEDYEKYTCSVVNQHVYLKSIFLDILSYLNVSYIVETALEGMEGKIIKIGENHYTQKGTRYEIAKLPTANPNALDDVEPGIPYDFALRIANSTQYQGNTKYTYDAVVTYSYMAPRFNDSGVLSGYDKNYIVGTTTYTNYIYLQ